MVRCGKTVCLTLLVHCSWNRYIHRRTRELNERTRTRPTDVIGWLELAAFQVGCDCFVVV